jgi:hypothetical protein
VAARGPVFPGDFILVIFSRLSQPAGAISLFGYIQDSACHLVSAVETSPPSSSTHSCSVRCASLSKSHKVRDTKSVPWNSSLRLMELARGKRPRPERRSRNKWPHGQSNKLRHAFQNSGPRVGPDRNQFSLLGNDSGNNCPDAQASLVRPWSAKVSRQLDARLG